VGGRGLSHVFSAAHFEIRSERVIIMMALFFIPTEWQLLSSLTALATSTSPESTAKDPWTDRKTTSAGTIVLHQ